MEPHEQVDISASEFAYLLTLTMVCDPHPSNIDSDRLFAWLNKVSKQFGYEDWAEAYHKIIPEAIATGGNDNA